MIKVEMIPELDPLPLPPPPPPQLVQITMSIEEARRLRFLVNQNITLPEVLSKGAYMDNRRCVSDFLNRVSAALGSANIGSAGGFE
ncbi:hypothetical protein LCGC14_0712770 [marine sediment metagenome]|uniref:Uncharacterized protein n=1 Tax=marine sediment metagenome TaxID=412755 RepID=A0A0F9QZY5_9ZZZZ